jgi:hypothetical protein
MPIAATWTLWIPAVDTGPALDALALAVHAFAMISTRQHADFVLAAIRLLLSWEQAPTRGTLACTHLAHAVAMAIQA